MTTLPFSLSTLRVADEVVAAVESGGHHFRIDVVAPELLLAAPARGLMNLLEDWEHAEARLAEVCHRLSESSEGRVHPQPDDFMAPLQFPNKLILAGANYYAHMVLDAGKPDFRKEDGTPVFFLKAPTTSLVGCGDTVRYPTQTKCLDWEIELAVVIGRRLRHVSPDVAFNGLAAYTIGIDLSARDWQLNPRHPWKFDLFTGKSFDDSCPLGPKLVPARFVDHRNLQLQLKVNGQLKQDAHSSDMIWSIAEQLSLLSHHITLEPGDVLLTGTPAGTGMASGHYLKPGDCLEAAITGLGVLSVRIVEDSQRN